MKRTYTDCFLQTEENVYEILSSQFPKHVIKGGIKEIEAITNMIDDSIDIGLNKGSIMPQVVIDSGFDSNMEYLRYLVYKNFDKKFGSCPATVKT